MVMNVNCLLVVSHPVKKSLCRALAQHVSDKLIAHGHEVVIENLYENSFDPRLTVPERQSYYGSQYSTAHVFDEVSRLENAENLILIFPTWWFGFPAILKGWFDRVWGPGVAFDHAQNLGAITPRLSKLQNVLVITTLGSPWWVDRLIMWQPVKRITKYALLGTCANKSKLQFLSLYKSENLTEAKVTTFKSKIDKALSLWM